MRSARLLPLALLLASACADDSKPAPNSGVVFEGVSWIAPDHEGHLVVSWKPLTDAKQYRVYASLHPNRALKEAPVATTTDTTIVLAPQVQGQRHYIVVRAVDGSGKEDANSNERSANAVPDTTPPTFAGVKTETPLANVGATLVWDPASDGPDGSPPEAIEYDVFGGRTPDTMRQLGRTKRGETTFGIDKLGEPAEQWTFEVRARDVGDNVSAEGKTLAGPLGGDIVPPSFAGCDAISNVLPHSLTIAWKPATDDHSKPEAIQYEVYAANAPGAQNFNAPPLAKVTNATSIDLTGLDNGKTYYFVCRARDAGGNLDANKNEKSVATLGDVTPPKFGGVTTATGNDTDQSVVLTWTAATDDTTDPSKIVYEVFESTTTGKYDFTNPVRVTDPAVTKPDPATGLVTYTLPARQTRVTLYWVVRARDEALNVDANVVETNLLTPLKTSFSRDVLPIFQTDCAVVGCHVTGIAPAGLNLATPFAYDLLVNVTAREKPPSLPAAKKRVAQGTADPLGDSWLWDKVSKTSPGAGSQMPAPQTGNTLSPEEKGIISQWILDGAPRN